MRSLASRSRHLPVRVRHEPTPEQWFARFDTALRNLDPEAAGARTDWIAAETLRLQGLTPQEAAELTAYRPTERASS